jgi:hypothetical protein
MGKYVTASKLSDKEFRRLIGIQKDTFHEMIKILKNVELKKKPKEVNLIS